MALLRRELSSTEYRSSRSTCIRYSKQLCLPPGALNEFVWKDYCTSAFRDLQTIGDIYYDDYMMTICRPDTIMEVFLRGKCCSSFYLPNDHRFVVKTMRKSEVKVLIDLLPSYCSHVKSQGKTLLTHLYGLHAVRPVSEGPKVYFVVMENVLKADLPIHKQYDLKGTSQGRTASKGDSYQTPTLKDLDFDFYFYIDASIRDHIVGQIQRDCSFLEEQGIMDYSLLLGIHRESHRQDETVLGISVHGRHKRDPTLADFFDTLNRPGFEFGTRLPARAVRVPQTDRGSISSCRRVSAEESCRVLLYFGIIDFLQNYNVMKKIEHAYKSLQFNSKEVPCINPKAYSARFQEFVSRVFLPEEGES